MAVVAFSIFILKGVVILIIKLSKKNFWQRLICICFSTIEGDCYLKRSGTLALVSALFLLSILMPFARASYVTTYDVEYKQTFTPAANGHYYIYDSQEDLGFYNPTWFEFNHRTSLIQYDYGTTLWYKWTYDINGVGSKMIPIQAANYISNGWLSNISFLPSFYDFTNYSTDFELSAVDERVYFGIPIDQEISVAFNAKTMYFGTFNVTDEEFFHIKVSSKQDDVSLYLTVKDLKGRDYGQIGVSNGDNDILPFAPDGPGTYVIEFWPVQDYSKLVTANILIKPITPEPLKIGEIVEGTLQGSEYLVDDSGNIIHDDRYPSIHTFKVISNSTVPGLVKYSINEPDPTDISYQLFPTQVTVTTDKTFDSWSDKYYSQLSTTSGQYYYKSFQGETYYITVRGMEGTEYSIYNSIPDVPELPIGIPIYLQNAVIESQRYCFKLSLATDSLMKVNATKLKSWRLFTVFSNGIYREINLNPSHDFSFASVYYIPKGNYLIYTTLSDWNPVVTTFTVGPVLDGVDAVAVDVGGLVGIRTPTENMKFYEVNTTLLTHDNVTVKFTRDLLTEYSKVVRHDVGIQLGNQQSGTGWVASAENRSRIITGLPNTFDLFTDGLGIVSLSPYEAKNNTPGATNEYKPYTVTFGVTFRDYTMDLWNGTATWTHGSTGWVNMTLGEPGDPTEMYLLEMNTEPGTWYNVTFLTEDVFGINNIVPYQVYDYYTQTIKYTKILDTFQGTVEHGQFQFGAVSDKVYLLFDITRTTGLVEGSLDILVTPFETNVYHYPPRPRYYGSTAIPGTGAPPDLLLIGGGITVAAVVVVATVVVIRKRKGA